MVISFFSGVMASGFAFGCAKDTVEFFNAGIGEVRFPVGEGFLLVIFDYVGPPWFDTPTERKRNDGLMFERSAKGVAFTSGKRYPTES